VHRDIRLPNILYVPDADEGFRYVLIDFEHAGYNKEKISGGWLKDWDNGTLTSQGQYTTQSDMYQFGKLLEQFEGMIESKKGEDFVVKLKNKKMSAMEACKHAWIQT
jgi:hypothetical protein